MRLTKAQVEEVSSLILKNLKKKELIIFKTDEKVVLNRIIDIFLNNLRAEDELNREVEQILEAYSNKLESGEVNYRRLFQMVKTKLARERNFVI